MVVSRGARPASSQPESSSRSSRYWVLKRRRREQRTVVVLFQNGQRLLAQLRREVDDVILCDSLPIKWSGLGREGLRWGGFLSGHRGLGNGFLFNGPDRLARQPVEDIAEALLAHLSDGLHRLSVNSDVNQVGCTREVVVPQPVVDHLKMPDALAGSRIQADQTLSKEAVAGTMNTVVIVRRRAERQVDVAQCVIRAHHRPDVRCPRRLPRTVLPSLVTKLSLSGNDMEYPLLLAGANIEASHVTGWHLCSQGNIVDLRTHNHNVATNDRWGGDSVQMAIDSTAQLLRQVNAPLATEGANRLVRLRVQADQIAVTGAKKDALIVTICPVGDAAMHEAIVGWRSVLPCFRIVDPPGLACRGVDGRDLGERGTDVQNAAGRQRSSFPNPSFQMIRFRDLLFGGSPCPRGSQAIEIAPAYLREK